MNASSYESGIQQLVEEFNKKYAESTKLMPGEHIRFRISKGEVDFRVAATRPPELTKPEDDVIFQVESDLVRVAGYSGLIIEVGDQEFAFDDYGYVTIPGQEGLSSLPVGLRTEFMPSQVREMGRILENRQFNEVVAAVDTLIRQVITYNIGASANSTAVAENGDVIAINILQRERDVVLWISVIPSKYIHPKYLSALMLRSRDLGSIDPAITVEMVGGVACIEHAMKEHRYEISFLLDKIRLQQIIDAE